jgi:SH3 domain-containing YSC84-like protein 1
MKIKLAILGLSLTIAFPLLAQKKEDQRLADSATVMKELSQGDNGLPKSVLNQAMCVLIFPSVKKVAVGIGGSYGRGVLVCRKGAKMDGEWGAPAMYALD